MICPTTKAEYFCAKGWTDFWVICPSGPARFAELKRAIFTAASKAAEALAFLCSPLGRNRGHIGDIVDDPFR
jgi:hypothetical protein